MFQLSFSKADEWHGQSSDARGRASGSQKGNSRGKNHNEEAAWNEWKLGCT